MVEGLEEGMWEVKVIRVTGEESVCWVGDRMCVKRESRFMVMFYDENSTCVMLDYDAMRRLHEELTIALEVVEEREAGICTRTEEEHYVTRSYLQTPEYRRGRDDVERG